MERTIKGMTEFTSEIICNTITVGVTEAIGNIKKVDNHFLRLANGF